LKTRVRVRSISVTRIVPANLPLSSRYNPTASRAPISSARVCCENGTSSSFGSPQSTNAPNFVVAVTRKNATSPRASFGTAVVASGRSSESR
jgi:hypothetical protein